MCGKPGHRMDTCTHPAGKLVSKLSAKLKNKTPEKRKPQRRKPMSTGAHRARASAAYTKRPELKGHKGRRCRRGRCPADSGGDSVVTLTDAAESPDRAIKLLQDAGFLYRPVHCPACAEPVGRLLARPGVSPDQRYHRCSSKSCKKYTNALWFGCFVGAACAQKLTPRQQAQCVVQYLNYEKLPPSAADVASDLKVGVAAVRQTIDKLRAAEASMGQTESDGVLLDGDVEMDEHSFRKFYVSRNNVHFAEAIAREDHKEDHPFFVVHLRCIGMRRRGGRALFIKMLPMRPLVPGSRPPPPFERGAAQQQDPGPRGARLDCALHGRRSGLPVGHQPGPGVEGAAGVAREDGIREACPMGEGGVLHHGGHAVLGQHLACAGQVHPEDRALEGRPQREQPPDAVHLGRGVPREPP